ncbi:hypothetical protein CVT26_015492, partial [Gymnopilus dilepis]
VLGEGLWPSHHVSPTHHTLLTEFQPVAHNLSPFPAQTTRFNHDQEIWRPHQYNSQYSYHQPAVPFPPSSAYPGPPSSNLGYHPNTTQHNARQRSEPQPQWLHHGPHPMNHSVSISTLQGRFQPHSNDSESAASTDETPFRQNDCHIPQNQYPSDIMRRRTEARLTSKRQARQRSRRDRQLDATGSSASPTSSNHPSLSPSPTDPARVHQPSSIDNMANIQAGLVIQSRQGTAQAPVDNAPPQSTTRNPEQTRRQHQDRSALLDREAERLYKQKSAKARRAGPTSSEGDLIERQVQHGEANGGSRPASQGSRKTLTKNKSRRTSEGQARRSKRTAPQAGPSTTTPTQKIGMKFQAYDPFEVRKKTSKAGGKRKADEDVPEGEPYTTITRHI